MSSGPDGRGALIGNALALTSAVAFAFTNTSASLAFQGGSNPTTLAAVRFVLPACILAAWLVAQGRPVLLRGRDGWIAAALGVITAAYSWALLTAIGLIPLALAILIFYLFPLIAAVILAVCGWEKLGWRTVVAIVVAFVGLALALDPNAGAVNWTGVGLAVAASVGLGVVVAVSGRLLRKGDSRPVTLYMAAVSAAILLPVCVLHGGFAFPATPTGWVGFAASTVFYAFAMIAFFVAVSLIGPTRSSLLCYAEPVVAAGLGVVLLGEALTTVQIVGIVMVVAALVGATLLKPGPKPV